MTRMVNCAHLKKEAEGLDLPPYPGDAGKRIWENISKEAWGKWIGCLLYTSDAPTICSV